MVDGLFNIRTEEIDISSRDIKEVCREFELNGVTRSDFSNPCIITQYDVDYDGVVSFSKQWRSDKGDFKFLFGSE